MRAQIATERQPKTFSRLRGALARARHVHPVWGLNLLLVAAAVALYAGPVHGLAPLAHPHLPWWSMAIAFAIAERCVVHLHFRRGAHSFSLGDIPLVFGLIFCSSDAFVVGCLLGIAIVMLFDRRLPPVKFVFNISQLAVHACVAILVMHALAPVSDDVGQRIWVAALVATQASGFLTVVLIAAAISLSEGLVKLRTILHMLSMDLVVTLSNASLGLCGAVIAAADARALPLLAVPSLTLFAAYRAYLSERERHKRLEFLYEANRTLARSREIADALEGLLMRSLEAFRAELAEIILFGSEENPSLRTLVGPGSYRELMEPVDSDVAEAMRELLEPSGGGAITVDSPFGGARLQRYLEARGVTHAIVAPLPGEERVIGAIMLANRFGVVRSFGHDDLRLLDTLAGNASVALQYDRLEQAVTQLSVLQEQLHHQAYHDPLTNLANRALFTDKVKAAIGDRRGELAVLFIDLDDFKTVNDSLGHTAGDELLVSVASRMRACLRPEDVVARFAATNGQLRTVVPGASSGSAPAGSSAPLDPRIETLAARNPHTTVQAIVQFNGPVTQAKAESDVAHVHGRLIGNLPIIHGLALTLTAAQARSLASSPDVHAVSLNTTVTPQSVPYGHLPFQMVGTGLSGGQLQTTYNQTLGVLPLWRFGVTGTGVGVAVVDTGVDGSLPDFASKDHGNSRVVASAVANADATTATDSYGHGTDVAGIIAGNGDNRGSGDPLHGRYIGVAPNANLISIKVSDETGEATVLDVIYGLQFAVAHRSQFNIRVVNLSLDSTTPQSYKTDPLDAAVEAAWMHGIVVVAAAGNRGATSDAVQYSPANDPYVITVGGVDENGSGNSSGDTIASWSSRGTTQDGLQKPDVYAPGAHIVSTLAPNSNFAASCPTCVVGNGQYIQTSGTSMATPMISGLVADLLQIHPNWTPDQVKGDLTSSAVADNSSLPEPNAVKAALLWNPPLADQGLTPNTLVSAATGNINYNLSSWSLSSWSRAKGPLRAGFALWSWSCSGCTASSGADAARASGPGVSARGRQFSRLAKGWGPVGLTGAREGW